MAVAATNLYENTRVLVQKYINAKDPNEIVFTKGATEAINLVASSYGKKYINKGLRKFALEVKSKKYPQKKHSY